MSDDILASLAEKYLVYLRSGSRISPESFLSDYPDYRKELSPILKMMRDMENFRETTPLHEKSLISCEYPQVLGDFILEEKLGEGGMGCVFAACQQSLNRTVAIKILSATPSIANKQIARFDNEAKIIASLHHPNIVQVFGAGKEGPFYFYVMEKVSGKSLDITKKRSATEVALIGAQAADALSYAHKHHILHRDIKPSNCLIDENGQLHLADFGIATVLSDDDRAEQYSEEGTLRYMAPEQLMYNECTPFSDQYSLGVTLYEMLSRRPFSRKYASTDLSSFDQAKLFKTIPSVPTDLWSIIKKSLSSSPLDRYLSMDEMKMDLFRFLEGKPVSSRKASSLRRLWLWSCRRPAVAAWSSAAILLACACCLSLFFGYVNSQRALKIADKILHEIFSTNAPKSGSENTNLLEKLLPYYEEIAERNNDYAHYVIGTVALRSGNAKKAEEALRKTNDRLLLAESLAAQGKDSEARKLWSELALEHNANAVRALRSLAGSLRTLPGKTHSPSGCHKTMKKAWDLLSKLRTESPLDPELQFLAASILAENPRLDKTEDPLEIMSSMVEKDPKNPVYRLFLVRVAGKVNPHHPNFYQQILLALKHGDILLTLHPFKPEVLSTVADVRMKYINTLLADNKKYEAAQEIQKSIGLFEILSRHPDAPEIGAKKLVEFQQRQENLLRKK